MQYTEKYKSPLGSMLLSADGIGLTGIWFDEQKYFAFALNKLHYNNEETRSKNTENRIAKDILLKTKQWLDIYFSGRDPDIEIPFHFIGSDFQKEVWEILCEIPYGKTITYGDIAKRIAKNRNLYKMSAQAVGGAVGRNNIPIIVPCHRVIGANGNLTGYAGGLDKKIALLKIENAFQETFFIPKK